MRPTTRMFALATGVAALLVGGVSPVRAGAAPGDPATVTGTLTAEVVDDFERGRSTTRLGVVPDGQRTRFVPLVGVDAANVPGLVGDRVRARGQAAAGGAIRVTEAGIAPAGGEAPPGSETALGGEAAIAGPRSLRVLAVIIRFADDPGAATPTAAAMTSRLFTDADSVRAFYADTSDGLWSISGRAVGPYTVTRPGTGTCERSDYIAWAQAAENAADGAGIDTSAYTHLMVVLPKTSVTCGWSGLGQLPGAVTWINQSAPSLLVTAHELGHNLGEHHASTYRCTVDGTRVTLATSGCAIALEYGDMFSPMGNVEARLHHTIARDHYDLINPADLAGGEARTVRIVPADTPTGVREVRVARPDGTWLAIEYRRPTGLFDDFLVTDPVVNGVTLRLDRGTGNRTYLLDARPSTSSFSDSSLPVGAAVTDPATGTRVRLVLTDARGAVVELTSPRAVTGLAVTRAAQTVIARWSPPTGLTGTLTYEVSLDGAAPTRITATRWTAKAAPGWHTVRVRAVDAAGTRYPVASGRVLVTAMGR